MTEKGFTVLFGVLDQVWGGVDADREQGYRFVLDRYDDDVVASVVERLAREDRPWLPKPPEIAARCERIVRERQTAQRMRQLLERVEERAALAQGDPAAVRAVVRRDLGEVVS